MFPKFALRFIPVIIARLKPGLLQLFKIADELFSVAGELFPTYCLKKMASISNNKYLSIILIT
jgi:hypothetical protein